MSIKVDVYAPTDDAKFLLSGIALMENVSVGNLLNRINKGREVQYSVYDYMDNAPLPFDLKQSLRQRFKKDKAISDEVMRRCYQRSVKGMKNAGLWLCPFVVLLLLLA